MASVNELASQIAERTYGSQEPDWSLPVESEKDQRLIHYYRWCNTNFNIEQLHGFIIDFVKHGKYNSDQVSHIKNSYPWMFLGVSGHIARLINNGVDVPKLQYQILIDKIEEALSKPAIKEKTAVTETIQDRMKKQSFQWIGPIEGEIDDNNYGFDTFAYLRNEKVDKPFVVQIQKHFAPQLSELYDAIEGLDADAAQAYKAFKRPDLLKRLNFIKKIMDDCARYSSGIKVEQKPKVKPSTKKILKGFKKVKKKRKK